MSTSDAVMPAFSKAAGPERAAAVTVKSGMALMFQCVWAVAAPRT